MLWSVVTRTWLLLFSVSTDVAAGSPSTPYSTRLPVVPAPIVTVVVPASELPITVFCVPVALMFVGPSTVTVEPLLPMFTAPVLVPVFRFVDELLSAFRFSAPEPALIVVVLVPFVLPRLIVLLAGPVPIVIV